MMGEMQLQGTSTAWTFGPTNTGNLQFYWYDGANKAATGNTVIPINTWTHIAVSLNSGAIKLFVNGNQETLSGTTTLTSLVGPGSYLAFGMVNSGGASTGYYGSISNFRIAKTAVYTGTFTVPTSPLQTTQTSSTNISAITGTQTSLLICQATALIDNSVNNFTLTNVSNPTPRTFNPFGVTNNTNQSYTPALYGGSAYFDGTGDYLSTPNSTNFNLGSNDFTIEGWWYPISSGDQNIVAKWWTGGSQWVVQWRAAGNFRFGWNTSSTADFSVTLPLNSWCHFAVVRSGVNLNFYYNGVKNSAVGTIGAVTATTDITTIGQFANLGSTYLSGYISDIRITNGVAIYTSSFVPPSTPLTTYSNTTPSSLLTNFTSGGVIDYHMNNVLETVGNAQLNTNVKQFGNASISFDGTGDYIGMPSTALFNFGTGNFTIEFWYYRSGTPQTSARLFQTRNGDLYSGISIALNTSGSAPNTLDVYMSSDGASYIIGSPALQMTLPDATWVYIAFVRNGSVFSLYKDGVQQSTASSASSLYYSSADTVVIGGQAGTSRSIFGYIDDFRITKLARYTSSPFPVPTAAFQTI